MHRVEPQVFLIAEQQVVHDDVQNYLTYIGAEGWQSDTDIDCQELIEVMGRGCYKSFGTELNPNLTRVRESNEAYLENIINIGHGSVLEHGWVSFMICDTSRVVTHELVRHRSGTAISQESLRFLRLEDMGLWMPQAYAGDEDSTDIFEETWEYLELQYTRLIARAGAIEGIPFDDLPFSKKKYYTSAARAARHIIEMRTDEHAEEEIRLVFNKIGDILKNKYPALFSDYAIEVTGADKNKEWATIRRKV